MMRGATVTMDDVESCPVCFARSRLYRHVRGYHYLRCGACGLQFLDVNPRQGQALGIYGDDYFFGGGAGYPNYLREASLLVDRGRRYARIIAPLAPPGRLLDVGSAAGFTLRGFAAAGWSGMGVEPNATMAEYARDVMGVDVAVGSIERFEPPGAFDLVTMFQVLAHVYDLDAALRSAAAATKPGGFWMIEELDSSGPLARAFGRQWHGYSPPSVLRIFTPVSLARLAERYGFEPRAAGRPMRWISAEHVKSLLSYKARDGWLNALAGAVARLLPSAASVPYPGQDLQWAIFQKVR